MMENKIIEIMKKRRSIYSIKNELPYSEEELIRRLEQVVLTLPTPFNSQSSKIVLLLGENHTKLWKEVTLETLRKVTPPDAFQNTIKKMESFAAGYGTILFFNDDKITQGLMDQFSLYRDYFIPWSEHANGMLQFAVWMMFAEEGIGASLQHYNPLIDEEVKKIFGIDPNWRLVAQMPFGLIGAPAGPKQSKGVDELFKVVK